MIYDWQNQLWRREAAWDMPWHEPLDTADETMADYAYTARLFYDGEEQKELLICHLNMINGYAEVMLTDEDGGWSLNEENTEILRDVVYLGPNRVLVSSIGVEKYDPNKDPYYWYCPYPWMYEPEELMGLILSQIRTLYVNHPTGGPLHIVLDDGNTEECHVKSCLEWMKTDQYKERFDERTLDLCRRIGYGLLLLSEDQRDQIYENRPYLLNTRLVLGEEPTAEVTVTEENTDG